MTLLNLIGILFLGYGCGTIAVKASCNRGVTMVDVVMMYVGIFLFITLSLK